MFHATYQGFASDDAITEGLSSCLYLSGHISVHLYVKFKNVHSIEHIPSIVVWVQVWCTSYMSTAIGLTVCSMLFVRERAGLFSVDCITLIRFHKRRLTTVSLSSLVSEKCPFAQTAYTHTCKVKGNQKFPVASPLDISSPLLSAVTYRSATSAARHHLSRSLWRPFNPLSKRSLSCQRRQTWPQY